MKGLTIAANGDIQKFTFTQKDFLAKSQAVVGGDVEHLRLLSGPSMWINEEGRLRKLDFNITASVISSYSIVGNVAITGLDGKSSLSKAAIALIRTQISGIASHAQLNALSS